MNDTSGVLAIIPARAGSKGVLGKNIRLLNGKPLLLYSCECVTQSRRVTRAVLSTDCSRMASLARESGVEVPFQRPAELARDNSPTLGVILHALNWFQESRDWQPDIVVLLQPTAPLRVAADVDQAIDQLVNSNADSVVSVCRVAAHFHPEWQFTITNGQLQTWKGMPVASVPTRRQLLSPTYERNGAVYAFRTRALRETGSIYGRHCLAFEMPAERSINIDSMDDWRKAEKSLSLVDPLSRQSA